MLNYDDIGREVREMEEATKFARGSGLADTVKRMKDFDQIRARVGAFPNVNIGALPDMNIGALPDVNIAALPNVNIGALPDVSIAALPDVNVNALASAERLATQALKSYSVPDFGDLLPKNFDQFQDLIGRATRLATAPSTQDLLRSADEVMAAARGVPVEEQPLDSADLEDLPNIPELDWMLQLDRDSLIFLCRLLFHLTAVLSPALGVGVALSDGSLDAEDWSPSWRAST